MALAVRNDTLSVESTCLIVGVWVIEILSWAVEIRAVERLCDPIAKDQCIIKRGKFQARAADETCRGSQTDRGLGLHRALRE